ncbi:hypothetical protein WISP_09629 [Willisornis vidua]|uniref:Reverse transcriptase domain-containing protein n=1 Tax=Willisornis vidua TaxID=1566151 RepID=A0ABQ9DSB7_9PASS|nr:hypothetical protein WISP_09629 [Willisornis vidua]
MKLSHHDDDDEDDDNDYDDDDNDDDDDDGEEYYCSGLTFAGCWVLTKSALHSPSQLDRGEKVSEEALHHSTQDEDSSQGMEPYLVRRLSTRNIQLPPLAFRQFEQAEWDKKNDTETIPRPTTLPLRIPPLIAITAAESSRKCWQIVIGFITPTLQADPAEKDKFYTDLRRLTQNVPADDKIIILGDFNARVGKNSEAWKGVLDKHGVGNCNDNGQILVEFCAEQQLTITNTIVQQKDSLKTTPDASSIQALAPLDYVLVQQRIVGDVRHIQVMPSAECQTDHCLVPCKLNLHFKLKTKSNSIPRRRLQVNNLQTATVRDSFQVNLQTRPEDHLTDRCSEALRQHINILQSSEESLGFSSKKNKEWLDENNQEIQELLKKKRTVHQAHLIQPSYHFLKMIIGQVRYDDAHSEPFPITNGVKQGCLLAPTLFTIFFSMMLQKATADLDDKNGIYIRYRTNGSPFNLRGQQYRGHAAENAAALGRAHLPDGGSYQ